MLEVLDVSSATDNARCIANWQIFDYHVEFVLEIIKRERQKQVVSG